MGEVDDTTLGVSEFKRRCLELLESVRREGRELVITKRGEPIARVSPVTTSSQPLRGLMKGRMTVVGEIVETDWSEEWEALE